MWKGQCAAASNGARSDTRRAEERIRCAARCVSRRRGNLGARRPAVGGRGGLSWGVIACGQPCCRPAEQLLLLDGQDQIPLDPDALEALPHGMMENSVIAAHSQARYQVIYQVSRASAHFTLRYRGFNSDTKKVLPDVAAQGHSSS
jgi:hypothetical protein